MPSKETFAEHGGNKFIPTKHERTTHRAALWEQLGERLLSCVNSWGDMSCSPYLESCIEISHSCIWHAFPPPDGECESQNRDRDSWQRWQSAAGSVFLSFTWQKIEANELWKIIAASIYGQLFTNKTLYFPILYTHAHPHAVPAGQEILRRPKYSDL